MPGDRQDGSILRQSLREGLNDFRRMVGPKDIDVDALKGGVRCQQGTHLIRRVRQGAGSNIETNISDKIGRMGRGVILFEVFFFSQQINQFVKGMQGHALGSLLELF